MIEALPSADSPPPAPPDERVHRSRRIVQGLGVGVVALLFLAWLVHAAQSSFARGRSSDIVRQWVVCRYLREGTNPYPLARAILDEHRSRSDVAQLSLFVIPRPVSLALQARVIAEIGPPEATYPPPAIGLLTLVLGSISDQSTVIAVWLVLQLAVLAAAMRLLRKQFLANFGVEREALLLLAVSIVLFSPFYATIEAGQFSVLTLVCLLVATSAKTSELVAGIALAVALIKPSLSLPFLFLPLCAGQWKRLLVAGSIQVLALLAVAWRLNASPIALVGDWLAVSRYFMQGMYTVQEVLGALGWRGTPAAIAVSVALLHVTAVIVWIARRAPPADRFAFVGMASLAWIYHDTYDFVFALPALLVLAVRHQVVRTDTARFGVRSAWRSALVGLLSASTALVLRQGRPAASSEAARRRTHPLAGPSA